MIKERIIDREYMLELDEEVKKGNIFFISLVRNRFIKSLLCKNIIFLKKFLIYVLDLKLDLYNIELKMLNNELLIDNYEERKNMLKNKLTSKQISLAINKPVKEITQTINI